MQRWKSSQGQGDMPEMDIEEIIMFYEGGNPEFGIPDFGGVLILSFLDMANRNGTDTLERLMDAYISFSERSSKDEEETCIEADVYVELALLAFLADYEYLSVEDLLKSNEGKYALIYEEDFRLIGPTDSTCETYEFHAATSRNVQYYPYEIAINFMTPYYAARIFEKEDIVEVPLWYEPGYIILLEPVFRTEKYPKSAMELLTRVVEKRTGDDMMQFLMYPLTYHRN